MAAGGGGGVVEPCTCSPTHRPTSHRPHPTHPPARPSACLPARPPVHTPTLPAAPQLESIVAYHIIGSPLTYADLGEGRVHNAHDEGGMCKVEST